MMNYIPDVNKFRLAGPPSWWLRQLDEFDPSLVVVPSRQGFYYRLAQRRPLKLAEHVVNDALFKESDTQMLATYGLVPVTTILATANWSNPYMFEELRRRAPWRMGGAAAVNANIEAMEKQQEIDKNMKINEMLEYNAKDAYKYYQMKRGLRSHMWSPKTPDRSQSKAQTPLIKIAS